MYRIIAFLCLLPLFMNGQKISYKIDDNKINTLVEGLMKEYNIPGIAIGVVVNDQLDKFYSYGFSNKESKQTIDENTSFQIGSVTKPMISLLALQLHEKGIIDINSPISKYLNIKLPKSNIPITIKHLMTHSSGLPQDPINRKDIPNTPTVPLPYSKKELYQGLKKTELLFEPGTNTQYSNLGYKLLGDILETVSKKKLEALIKESLFLKVGMDNSYISEKPNSVIEASHYWPMDKAKEEHDRWEIGEVWGSGGVSSSISDLSKFVNLQFKRSNADQPILSSSSINFAHTPQIQANRRFTEFIGLGWYLNYDKNYGLHVYHSGDADGNSSYISFLPEYGIGFIVLANLGRSADEIGEGITETVYSHIAKMKNELQEAFVEQDWDQLISTASELIKLNPSNSRAQYFLGKALYKQKQYDKAINHLTIADNAGMYRDYALFYLACCYANKKENKKAFKLLERAVNLGFINGDDLVQDENMKQFSGTDVYKKLARYSHDHH